LLVTQKIFGYTNEDVESIVKPMVKTSKEPIGSMGDDTPLAVLSEKPRLLYTYFRQRFAQVTNPPIDPLREKLVMSCTLCWAPPLICGMKRRRLPPHPVFQPVAFERTVAVVANGAAGESSRSALWTLRCAQRRRGRFEASYATSAQRRSGRSARRRFDSDYQRPQCWS
jgi:hypothetical protein